MVVETGHVAPRRADLSTEGYDESVEPATASAAQRVDHRLRITLERR
jgi:hypothetical protein